MYLDRIQTEYWLYEGHEEGGHPFFWLLFTPFHTVQHDEEGTEERRHGNQEPRHVYKLIR